MTQSARSVSGRFADVVIGAGYGDEGKGVLTDALAARHGESATVVRFNGGAQAGHTVTCGNGRRHVFHHVGAGAFVGAATYLSRFFVANPILLVEEIAELGRLGVVPRIAIDPAAPVTTPYDMMINQCVERARGDHRHGSCGLGFGETLERNRRPEFALTVGQLCDRDDLRARLERIRHDWAPARLRELGAWPLDSSDLADLASDAILERWFDDVEAFRACLAVAPISNLAGTGPLIFEGAQGLRLDQDYGDFPHVTRSNTGLKNVVALAAEIGLTRLRVIYVTRAYVTRHGAGPLAHERDPSRYRTVVDDTNIANMWQGTLRYGALDCDRLRDAIVHDLAYARTAALAIEHDLAVTCLDQLGEAADFVAQKRWASALPRELAEAAAGAVNAGRLIAGHGPARENLAGLS